MRYSALAVRVGAADGGREQPRAAGRDQRDAGDAQQADAAYGVRTRRRSLEHRPRHAVLASAPHAPAGRQQAQCLQSVSDHEGKRELRIA